MSNCHAPCTKATAWAVPVGPSSLSCTRCSAWKPRALSSRWSCPSTQTFPLPWVPSSKESTLHKNRAPMVFAVNLSSGFGDIKWTAGGDTLLNKERELGASQCISLHPSWPQLPSSNSLRNCNETVFKVPSSPQSHRLFLSYPHHRGGREKAPHGH